MVTTFTPSEPFKVFISYAHEDEDLLKQFEPHLKILERREIITPWHGRKMVAGTIWPDAISQHINSAQIVLLLVSTDFMASDYCYGVEFELAMQRRAVGAAEVIPVILRPCDWPNTPLGTLQALPKAGLPVVKWHDRDEAFLSVTDGITEVVKQLERVRLVKESTSIKVPPEIYSRTKSLATEEGATRNPRPLEILKEAIHAFPIVKYALVIGSITAAAAIGPGSRIDSKLAILGPVALALMFGLLTVSWMVRHSTGSIKRLALTLAWISVFLSASTSLGIFLVYFSSPKPVEEIQILVTEIPPYNPDGGPDSHGHIAGTVTGARSPEFCLVIYSLTTSWYVQPRANDFETRINPDGGWSADIQAGSKYAVLLVRPNYRAPWEMSDSPTRMDGVVTSIEFEGKKVK